MLPNATIIFYFLSFLGGFHTGNVVNLAQSKEKNQQPIITF